MAAQCAFDAMHASLHHQPSSNATSPFFVDDTSGGVLHLMFVGSSQRTLSSTAVAHGKDSKPPRGRSKKLTDCQIRWWIQASCDAGLLLPTDDEISSEANLSPQGGGRGGLKFFRTAIGGVCVVHRTPLLHLHQQEQEQEQTERTLVHHAVAERLADASLASWRLKSETGDGPVTVIVVHLAQSSKRRERQKDPPRANNAEAAADKSPQKKKKKQKGKNPKKKQKLLQGAATGKGGECHNSLDSAFLPVFVCQQETESSLAWTSTCSTCLFRTPILASVKNHSSSISVFGHVSSMLTTQLARPANSFVPSSSSNPTILLVTDEFLVRSVFFKVWCRPEDFLLSEQYSRRDPVPVKIESNRQNSTFPVQPALRPHSPPRQDQTNIAASSSVVQNLSIGTISEAFEMESLWNAVCAQKSLLKKQHDHSLTTAANPSPPLLLSHVILAGRGVSENRRGVEGAYRKLSTAKILNTVNTTCTNAVEPLWFLAESAEQTLQGIQWSVVADDTSGNNSSTLSVDEAAGLLRRLVDLRSVEATIAPADCPPRSSLCDNEKLTTTAPSLLAVHHALLRTDISLSIVDPLRRALSAQRNAAMTQ